MTIKTQGGKIITKDGKVSCACCEAGECCLYPFEEFYNSTYLLSDLPDEIKFEFTNVFYGGTIQGILKKLDPPIQSPFNDSVYYYKSDDSFLFSDPGGPYYQIPCIIYESESFDSDRWVFTFTPEEFPFEGYGINDDLIGIDSFRNRPFFCTGLIGEWASTLLISDQFADVYTISGSVSGTVTRESVCVWQGPGLTLTNFGNQWKVNGNNKSGFQNTPVGSYAGGWTVL